MLGIFLLFLASNVAWADLVIKNGDKIAFLGDSITARGWEFPGGYVKLTVAGLEILGVKIVPFPAGVSGNTSRDMLKRFDHDVLSKKPDWLTLSCGVNDVWHGVNGVPLEEYEQNITSMVDQAQKAGIKVVLMTPTVIGEDANANNQKLTAYIDFLHKLATERHLAIAEENAAFQEALKSPLGLPPYLTADGVHPNPDGAQIMARTLLTAFGASPAQVDQVQQNWIDMPASAWAQASFAHTICEPITIRQYNGLKPIAATHKVGMRDFLENLYVQALGDAIQAHRADVVLDPEIIQQDANKAFVAKIAELDK